MSAIVRTEPRVYAEWRTDRSFFQDLALLHAGAPETHDALDRLNRHREEVEAEMADPHSIEGRRARAILTRDVMHGETRAVTTTTSTGFTTPTYLIDLWAGYRSANRSFIDATMQLPLPEYGVQVNIPSFTGPTTAAQQTENFGQNTASPTGADIPVTVVTLADAVPLSQQLFDRGGLPGLTFDSIIVAQLSQSMDAQSDLYVINQVTGGITNAGNTVTDNSAFSIANFYKDVATARESLADLAGTRLKATHLFSTTDIFSYVTHQVDDQHRPIVTPAWAAEPWATLKSQGDSAGDGWLSHVLPGDIAWFSDDNIPTNTSSQNQLIVSRPNSVISMESDFIPYAYPETSGNTLTVFVGVRKYAAAAARFPNAHAVITGSAYANTEV